jgi:hypothetical protein
LRRGSSVLPCNPGNRRVAQYLAFRHRCIVLLCHIILRRRCCFCRQQGQRGRRWTRPTIRRRRMLAIECGRCRSGRTGTARLEALG